MPQLISHSVLKVFRRVLQRLDPVTLRRLAERFLSVAARLQATADATVSVFGAFIEDRLVGIGALARTTTEKAAHNTTVCGMYVSPAFRRRRIGQALLDAIIVHARTFTHLRNLKLGVNASNVAAIQLYESRGFARYGLEPEALCVDGVFYDEQLYALPLNRNAWLNFWSLVTV